MWKNVVVSVLISCLICFGFSMIGKGDQQIAVVDAVRLFNGYQLKVELEALEKKKLLGISRQLDSVNNSLQTARAMKNENAEKQLMYSGGRLKEQLDQEYEAGNKLINEQVWKRLNSAVEQFGKQKKVHLIIGANGMGTVLYNDGYYDITDEAIKYVNKKYEEGN